MKHTIGDLHQMQSLPLKYKIIMTQQRIKGWYEHWDGNVYVSFSGGKDSTVLVDIVTKMGYTDIPLVFVDTGLEYPEIREFVGGGYGDRVVWLRPKLNFKQVIEQYGYPFISKEVSGSIAELQTWINKHTDANSDKPRVEQIREQIMAGDIEIDNVPVRMCYLLGMYDKHNKKKIEVSKEDRSVFCKEKWKFLIDADFFKVSNQCCNIMKKGPIKRYNKETGRYGITAQMASESQLRTTQWLKNGCNGFEMKNPLSNPMSFWTEQDVLLYIKQFNLPICSVYGDVIEDLEGTEEVEGQMTMSDIDGWEDQGMFDAKRPLLKTTGCNRTGCMFCGFGCHLEKESRFVRMKETHPKQYDYIMRPWDQGGLNYKQVIDWINEHGNVNIRY